MLMSDNNHHNEILNRSKELSTEFDNSGEVSIILAAGHGKRIKSQKSKMLHKIWGIPTVERVYNACRNGIDGINSVIVVGIKALDVMEVIGKRKRNVFAYQETQNGTGHAVQIALKSINGKLNKGIVYVLPGDMGLLNSITMTKFRQDFIDSEADMVVLTGIFEGNDADNYYGRIIRVKETDVDGKDSGIDKGNVIQIMEYKDIMALDNDKTHTIDYKGRHYSFTKDELIKNKEFNSGVYAFDYNKLIEQVDNLTSDNVQNEIYITDLINLFNKKGYSVAAVEPDEPYVVMGFNNKSVLKEMEAIAREKIYNKLKDIIEIDDPEDFYIHEKVVEKLVEQDAKGVPLDIKIGKGVHIGADVDLHYNVEFHKNVFVDGNVVFGKNCKVWENVHLSAFPGQTLKLGDNVEILWGDIIKGNIIIGDNSRIESSVNMTGSDEHPLRIGKHVLIKGTSYIFGSIIEDGIFIEHSVIIRKRIKSVKDAHGKVKPVKFYLPEPRGSELIEKL
jgi:bifunctional UDP-N-acetylglucosamine pyrophosphorylase / glucosamine-1-phosphate N-acetyltransferase